MDPRPKPGMTGVGGGSAEKFVIPVTTGIQGPWIPGRAGDDGGWALGMTMCMVGMTMRVVGDDGNLPNDAGSAGLCICRDNPGHVLIV